MIKGIFGTNPSTGGISLSDNSIDNILENADQVVSVMNPIYTNFKNCTVNILSLHPGFIIFYGPSVLYSLIISTPTIFGQITDWLSALKGYSDYNLCFLAAISGGRTAVYSALVLGI